MILQAVLISNSALTGSLENSFLGKVNLVNNPLNSTYISYPPVINTGSNSQFREVELTSLLAISKTFAHDCVVSNILT